MTIAQVVIVVAATVVGLGVLAVVVTYVFKRRFERRRLARVVDQQFARAMDVMKRGRTELTPPGPAPCPMVMNLLEQVYQAAKAGKVQHIAVVSIYDDECTGMGWTCSPSRMLKMTGLLAALQNRITKRWDSDDDPAEDDSDEEDD